MLRISRIRIQSIYLIYWFDLIWFDLIRFDSISDYNITAGEILDLTNKSYEFNLSASQAELKVLSGTTQIASCFLRLDHLLDAPSIDGLQERSSQETIISEHGVLGYIRVSLEMHTDLGSGSKYSQKKSQPRCIFQNSELERLKLCKIVNLEGWGWKLIINTLNYLALKYSNKPVFGWRF